MSKVVTITDYQSKNPIISNLRKPLPEQIELESEEPDQEMIMQRCVNLLKNASSKIQTIEEENDVYKAKLKAKEEMVDQLKDFTKKIAMENKTLKNKVETYEQRKQENKKFSEMIDPLEELLTIRDSKNKRKSDVNVYQEAVTNNQNDFEQFKKMIGY